MKAQDLALNGGLHRPSRYTTIKRNSLHHHPGKKTTCCSSNRCRVEAIRDSMKASTSTCLKRSKYSKKYMLLAVMSSRKAANASSSFERLLTNCQTGASPLCNPKISQQNPCQFWVIIPPVNPLEDDSYTPPYISPTISPLLPHYQDQYRNNQLPHRIFPKLVLSSQNGQRFSHRFY